MQKKNCDPARVYEEACPSIAPTATGMLSLLLVVSCRTRNILESSIRCHSFHHGPFWIKGSSSKIIRGSNGITDPLANVKVRCDWIIGSLKNLPKYFFRDHTTCNDIYVCQLTTQPVRSRISQSDVASKSTQSRTNQSSRPNQHVTFHETRRPFMQYRQLTS